MVFEMTENNKRDLHGWEKVKTLGNGSFGIVDLWINKNDSEEIALKQIRATQEMTDQAMERWKKEIEIMKRLDHPNVIIAKEIPPPLAYLGFEYPVLAMEYCSQGDLRKVISKSCYGFKEAEVIRFAKDVASGVEYLHSKRIVHRDLKPENIVQQETNNKIVYKLIDLGYAKDLDQGSICSSFVGTLQYLAPELFLKQPYTHTVDYWSLGSVIFEIITGYRPFLPNLSPVLWYKQISKKNDDHITAFYDSEGIVQLSSELPKYISLCRPLKQSFEKWLKGMLSWDANIRGNDHDDRTKRQRCFLRLEKIIEIKILRLYHVMENNLLCYMLEPNQPIEAVQQIISAETGIPVAEQEILTMDGCSPDGKQLAEEFISRNGDEDVPLFLLDKKKLKTEKPASNSRSIPQRVHKILEKKSPICNDGELKKTYAEAVYYCEQIRVDCQHLIHSIKACSKAKGLVLDQFSKPTKKLCDIIPKIYTKVDFLSESLQLNKQRYNDVTSNRINNLPRSWAEMEKDVRKIKELAIKAESTKERAMLNSKRASKNPNMTSITECFEKLTQIVKKVNDLYINTKKDISEMEAAEKSQHDMKRLLVECINKQHSLFKNCDQQLLNLYASRLTLLETLPEIEETTTELLVRDNRIDAINKNLICYVWKLVENSTPSGQHMSNVAWDNYSLPSTDLQESMKVIEDSLTIKENFSKLISDMQQFVEHESLSTTKAIDQLTQSIQ